MMQKLLYKHFLKQTKKDWFVGILLVISLSAVGQTITVGGTDWNLDLTGEITEAGNGFTGTYESASNQILLTVSNGLLLTTTTTSIHYEVNTNWHSNFIIEARRTGGPSGGLCVGCSISGGTTYQTVTLTSGTFFQTSVLLQLSSFTDIPVQLRLSGIDTTIPVGNYQARIVFTVSNN